MSRHKFCETELTLIERLFVRFEMVRIGWEINEVWGLDDYNLLDALWGELDGDGATDMLTTTRAMQMRMFERKFLEEIV